MRRPSHLPMAKLAYQDPRFMESLGARPLRILAEYLDPLARLRRENERLRMEREILKKTLRIFSEAPR